MYALPETSQPARSPYRNGWQLFIRLISGRCQPPEWQRISYRSKFLLRSLIYPATTLPLLNMISQLAYAERLLHVQPMLPCRLHRPYLLTKLSRRQRLDIICFHYQHFLSRLPSDLLWQTLHSGASLAQLQGKDQENYRITLRSCGALNREGEITLNFLNSQHILLARLTFVFCRFAEKTTLFIGGLQGAAASVDHEQIQLASKACHGLFPKRLLLEAVIQLAALYNTEQILAVSNQAHIYNDWRYSHKKLDKLHADYDHFWLSLGASARTTDYYQLPLPIPRKSMEDIASKKRAEYRRRYALLDSLTAQINQCFTP